MTHLIRRGTLFALPLLAMLFAIERLALLGATNCHVGEPGKVNLIMQHRSDPDLAIFGSSNALTAFDTPLIESLSGLDAYNFGLYGTPFVQYQALLREFADTTHNAKVVVIAEMFMTFRSLKALRGPDRWVPYASNPHVRRVMDAIDPDLGWRLRNVPFYSLVAANTSYYGSVWRGYRNLLAGPPPEARLKGFLPVDQSFVLTQFDDDHGHNDRIVADFAETLDALARTGAKLVVLVTPLAAECHHMAPRFAAHRAQLRELLGYRGLFLDYASHPIAHDSDNFYNCGHLNVGGAEAFSQVFVEDLRAALPDVPWGGVADASGGGRP